MEPDRTGDRNPRSGSKRLITATDFHSRMASALDEDTQQSLA